MDSSSGRRTRAVERASPLSLSVPRWPRSSRCPNAAERFPQHSEKQPLNPHSHWIPCIVAVCRDNRTPPTGENAYWKHAYAARNDPGKTPGAHADQMRIDKRVPTPSAFGKRRQEPLTRTYLVAQERAFDLVSIRYIAPDALWPTVTSSQSPRVTTVGFGMYRMPTADSAVTRRSSLNQADDTNLPAKAHATRGIQSAGLTTDVTGFAFASEGKG